MATLSELEKYLDPTPQFDVNLESVARGRDLQTGKVEYTRGSPLSYFIARLKSSGIGADQDGMARALGLPGAGSKDKTARQKASQEIARLFSTGEINDLAENYLNQQGFDTSGLTGSTRFKANPVPPLLPDANAARGNDPLSGQQQTAPEITGQPLGAGAEPTTTGRAVVGSGGSRVRQGDRLGATTASFPETKKMSGQQTASPQPTSTVDIITDPVTGRSYSRDLAIPGSTYKPYTGQTPLAPAKSIASPVTYQAQTPDTSEQTSLDDILSSYGFSFNKNTGNQFKIAPVKSFKEVYSGLYESLGLSDVKTQVDETLKKIGAMDQELADKIADINENPWLSEGVRVQRVRQLEDRYELKKAPHASNLTTLESLWNDGREEARYVATQSLNQYNQEREFQLDQIQEMQRQAENERESAIKISEFIQKQNKPQSLSDTYGSGVLGEYAFAVSQGYTGSFRDYQNEDANRKASIVRAGSSGLTPYQTNQAFIALSNKYQADPFISAALKGQTAVAIANQIIANPNSATSQLKSLYVLVKNLDADSAVREGELALARQTQSYLQSFGNVLTRIGGGRVIAPDAAKALAVATKELATAWKETAARRQKQYMAQATTANVGAEFKNYLSAFESEFSREATATPEDYGAEYDHATSGGFKFSDLLRRIGI